MEGVDPQATEVYPEGVGVPAHHWEQGGVGENHLFERNFSEIFARQNLTFAVSRNLTFEMTSFHPWGRLTDHQGPRELRQRDQMSPAKNSGNKIVNQNLDK